ncbi:MAG: GNVR domain-containing protein, partial [Gemmatimonadota bacterium]
IFNGFALDSIKPPIAGDYRLKIASDRKTWELTNTATSQKEHGAVGDSVGLQFGFHWLPVIQSGWAGESFDFTVLTAREAADDIRKRLHVDLLPAGAPRFMALTLNGQDGESTAGVMNDLMRRFVEQTSKAKRHNLTTQVQVFDSMLNAAVGKLHEDERALQTLRIKTIALPRDLPVAPGLAQTTPTAYNAFVAQQNELKALKKDRTELDNALRRLQAGEGAIDLFSVIPSVKQSPELMSYLSDLVTQEGTLQQLRVRYTDTMVDKEGKVDMPKLVRRVNDLKNVIVPRAVRVVEQHLDSLIAHNGADIVTATKELEAIPQRTIDENSLMREQSNQEQIVTSLTNQYYAAKSKEASATTDVSISDIAVAPLRPNKNRTNVIILFGTLAGLGAGLGLALLLDLTDKRVRYADQVTTGLGLTILGVIPEIRRTKGKQPTVEEAAQVIEAFRTVRLNLAHTIGQGKVVLTISSPSPGDGKSLITSNLALSFAESGYRTLLIDGDSRRGELHRTFGAERRPGLLDYLVGELPLDQLVRSTTHEQLKLITGGS